jgi:hypothetical protein
MIISRDAHLCTTQAEQARKKRKNLITFYQLDSVSDILESLYLYLPREEGGCHNIFDFQKWKMMNSICHCPNLL